MLSNQRLDVFFKDGSYYLNNKTASSLAVICYQFDDLLFAAPTLTDHAPSNELYKINLDFTKYDSYYIFCDNHLLALVNPDIFNKLIDYIVFDIACSCEKKSQQKKSKCSKCKEKEMDCNKSNFLKSFYRYFLVLTRFDDNIQNYYSKLNIFMLDSIDSYSADISNAINSLKINGTYTDLSKYQYTELMFLYIFLEQFYKNDFDFKKNIFNRCAKSIQINIFSFEDVDRPINNCLPIYSTIPDAHYHEILKVNEPYVLDIIDGASFPIYIKLYESMTYAYTGDYPIYTSIENAQNDNALGLGEKYILNISTTDEVFGELYIKLKDSNGLDHNGCIAVHGSELEAIESEFLSICEEWAISTISQYGKLYLKTKKVI